MHFRGGERKGEGLGMEGREEEKGREREGKGRERRGKRKGDGRKKEGRRLGKRGREKPIHKYLQKNVITQLDNTVWTTYSVKEDSAGLDMTL